ncbi:copper resistance protein NlpE N-terminal domain-containing protein [Chromatiaceae bacterium AAb-1]|nr:copper resistance protein NlpE N-terminal domain-containing protein [Chromatiaceae bacterium AAb-1]
MSVRILTLLSCCWLLLACEPSQQAGTAFADRMADTEHNSRNVLDWAGQYEGILPCADCEGIRTRLTLYEDERYQLQTEYLGELPDQFQESGSFVWNNAGTIIRLQGDGSSGNRQFQVGENRLRHLDQEGNPITGALAEHYILNKIQSLAEDSSSSAALLAENRWQLTELMGAVIPPDTGIFLRFNPDNTVHGFAGCNQLAGNYQLDGLQLSLQQVVTTRKACMAATPETEFLNVLAQIDNYTISHGQLTLNKGKMAPLARFSVAAD